MPQRVLMNLQKTKYEGQSEGTLAFGNPLEAYAVMVIIQTIEKNREAVE